MRTKDFAKLVSSVKQAGQNTVTQLEREQDAIALDRCRQSRVVVSLASLAIQRIGVSTQIVRAIVAVVRVSDDPTRSGAHWSRPARECSFGKASTNASQLCSAKLA